MEKEGQRVMKQQEITVRDWMKTRGQAAATVWTCDLSYDYVKINAEYREAITVRMSLVRDAAIG